MRKIEVFHDFILWIILTIELSIAKSCHGSQNRYIIQSFIFPLLRFSFTIRTRRCARLIVRVAERAAFINLRKDNSVKGYRSAWGDRRRSFSLSRPVSSARVTREHITTTSSYIPPLPPQSVLQSMTSRSGNNKFNALAWILHWITKLILAFVVAFIIVSIGSHARTFSSSKVVYAFASIF